MDSRDINTCLAILSLKSATAYGYLYMSCVNMRLGWDYLEWYDQSNKEFNTWFGLNTGVKGSDGKPTN